MGRVLTNNTTLSYSIESTLGVLAGSPIWKLLEPNTIGRFGAEVTKVPRSPISKLRQRRKGAVVDLKSGVEFEHDLTREAALDFMEGFCFARFNTGSAIFAKHSGALFDTLAAQDGSPGPNAFTFSTALGSAPPANMLVYARGWSTAGNNGLKLVASGSTTTIMNITETLVDETPTQAQNATVEVAGRRGASGDIQIDANGDIISTVLDFTTLGLKAGQMIHVGGALTANQFATAANKGFCRIRTIAAQKITLDKRPNAFVADNGSGKLIDLLFGRFLSNVAADHALFTERSFQFEGTYVNLQNPGPGDAYEYPKGNMCNEMGMDLPLNEKATIGFNFVGTDTPDPTTTRATNASTPVLPVDTAAFGTASDIARLRIQKVDETGITTCFKSLRMIFRNNVGPENCLGTLGAAFMNSGNFEVDVEAQLLFTHAEVPAAIRANTTLTMDWVLKNSDGAIGFDVPSMTLNDGGKEFPVNQSVLINTTAEAFVDPVLGTSIGISLFPFVP